MTGLPVQGERLKRCRIEARLTQEQLAHLAGCSDRVLRKAEAGGSVRQSTIQRIVAVLAEYGQLTSLQDLTNGPSDIALRFFHAYNRYGADLCRHFDLFADDLLIVVPVASRQFPFAGQWIGLKGFESCLDKYSQVFWREKLAAVPVILETGNQVTIRYSDQWQKVDFPKNRSTIWVNWHLDVSAGKIGRIEYQFDSLASHLLCCSGKPMGTRKRLVR